MGDYPPHSTRTETANDRFKQGFGSRFWASVIAATLVHFFAFALWPNLTAADIAWTSEAFVALDLPPEIDIPPPPEQIARPATPVVGDTEIDDLATIPFVPFDEYVVEIRPPATSRRDGPAEPDRFTPMTVVPRLGNQREVERALERNYPPVLRDSGIGGSAEVWFFIDEDGRVLKTELKESSGYEQLDQAALRVADVMQFSPAWNRDKKVQVWVSIPITFRSR